MLIESVSGGRGDVERDAFERGASCVLAVKRTIRGHPARTTEVGAMSTGMPAGIWLTKFGVIVRDYFGEVPFQVGSSLHSKAWRDVDVRLILDDAEFEARFGSNPSSETNPKLAAITLAFAALGSQMTGLPVDFQIQPRTWANDRYPGPRSALFELHED